MRTIIIEDETAAVRNLKAILREVAPEINVVAALDSVGSSVVWLKNNAQPDVIFMDIHLADGESFHIFDQVQIEVPVIFITAYDEYALQAFKANGIDYLLKPVKQHELAQAMAKLKKFTHAEPFGYVERLSNFFPAKQHAGTLLIFFKNKIIPLDTAAIAFFCSQNEKTQVYTIKNQIYPTEKTLNALMEILNPKIFFRANRQYIISRNAIKEIMIHEGNRLWVELNIATDESILISREKSGEFKKWLQNE